MKFDVVLPGTNRMPDQYEWAHHMGAEGHRQVLQTVDSLRFHAILVAEHLGMPHHEVPRLGGYWQEPLTTMAFVAGTTRNVRIDTNILVLPYHHPLRLAKALATIDVLSEGRVNLSIGIGHAEQEFATLGVPFNRRGAITDEVLRALEVLWTDPMPEHKGDFFEITGLAVEPLPVQRPRPPIYVGGNSKPALRRAARHDGWQPNPLNFTLAEVPPLLDYLREQPEFSGKESTFDVNWLKIPSGVRLPKGFARSSPSELRGYRDELAHAYGHDYPAVGVTRTTVAVPRAIASVEEYRDYLTWFAEEVTAAVSPRGASAQAVVGSGHGMEQP